MQGSLSCALSLAKGSVLSPSKSVPELLSSLNMCLCLHYLNHFASVSVSASLSHKTPYLTSAHSNSGLLAGVARYQVDLCFLSGAQGCST